LNKNKVKYLVVGGVACGIYGSPRATVDLDLLIEPTVENAKRLHKALAEAGLGTAHLTTPEQILSNEINVFKDIFRLDILTKAKGIQFEKCWPKRERRFIDKVPVYVLSLKDLIASKVASNRKVDRQDAEVLKKIRG